MSAQQDRARGAEDARDGLPESKSGIPEGTSGQAEGKSIAILCSGFTCQPPIHTPEESTRRLTQAIRNK